jgi:hypothetical protein
MRDRMLGLCLVKYDPQSHHYHEHADDDGSENEGKLAVPWLRRKRRLQRGGHISPCRRYGGATTSIVASLGIHPITFRCAALSLCRDSA